MKKLKDMPMTSKDQDAKLKRSLTPIQLLFLSFSAIFGSGWLFAPYFAAQIAGPLSLIAWILGGVISVIIGITMAEVVSLYPKSGGLFIAASKTQGPLVGLISTLLTLIVMIVLPALETRAVIQYLASIYPELLSEQGLSLIGLIVASLLLLIIGGLNFYGAKAIGRINLFLVIFKLVTPVILIASFFHVIVQLGHLELDHLSQLFSLYRSELMNEGDINWSLIFQAIATGGILFSFNGFNQATVFAGEAKNPSRSVPFAIIGSLLLTTAIYFVIQLVFILALPLEELSGGWRTLSFPGSEGPFAGLAKLLGLNALLVLIYADAFVSPSGTAFNYSSAAPRLLLSLSETLGTFSILTKTNKKGAPWIAISVCFFLEVLVFHLLPNLQAMISFLVSAFVLCYTVTPISLILHRKSLKTRSDFHLPYANLFCFLTLFFSNLMVLSTGWTAMSRLAMTATGLFLLLGLSGLLVRNRKPANQLKQVVGSFQIRPALWFLVEVLGLFLISFLRKEYAFSFGMLSILTALFSLGVLFLAVIVGPATKLHPGGSHAE